MQHASDTCLLPQGEDCSWAKLTDEQVIYIRDNPDNLTGRQLAEMFGVNPQTISFVQTGATFKNVGGKIRDKIKSRVPDEVREQIRNEYKFGVRGCGLRTLAKKFGVDPSTILNIVRESNR